LVDRATFQLRLSKELQERQHIEEISAMKVKFFTNLSHELRTPVSLIMLPIENMLAKNLDAGVKNNLTMVLRNAKRLLFIVNQLLDFRKLEVGEISYHPVIGNIVSFIKDVTLPFTDIAQNKNIKLTVKSNIEELYTNFDHNKLERILFNLLSNAFKFTPNHGAIDVNIQYNEEKDLPIRIEVTDTGIGIDKNKIENIFKPFYQADNQGSIANMGTGIGLSITYEFVRLHNGNIHVESVPDKGTSFIIELPMSEKRAPVIKEDLPEEELIISAEEMKIPTLDLISKKNRTILIVDDNDDFRFYLVENLRRLYNVIEANNGEIAYEKANRFLPDIIVSDIKMPVMDGIDFCRKVKTEVNTSHIPVVLLTANNMDDDKITGFEAGADEYISKPFNVGVLIARLRNLLIKKDEQRTKLNSQSGIQISEINLPTLDEKLIEKVNKYTLENISDTEFGIEELSKAIGMSTVYLNKKISALTGKTSSEYVRSIRLRRAAQLLEKSDLSISEVAYEVGYNSPKYFSKYFKDEYNILPSEYRKNFM
jgi:DNA-binding response OmpR family regulator/nitrogen-specific signal transduction histidine kinase